MGTTNEIRRYFVPSQSVSKAIGAIKEDMAAGRKASQVSFKLNATWAEAANGASDAWARDAAKQMAATVAGTGHRVQVAIQHEPENDGGSNDGSTVAGRDAWVGMQARLGPIFRAQDLEYGVIIMGYHSMPKTNGNTAVWLLEKWLPRLAGKVNFLGLDLYASTVNPTSFESKYLTYIKAQTDAAGLEWGLSESAISPENFATHPGWFDNLNRLLPKYGGSFFAYFNTGLNNGPNQLYMDPGDDREKGFVKLLKTQW